jgi:hypothetical protein
MSAFRSLDLATLDRVTGGALPSLGSIWDRVKPYLPSPTIPLGPYYPPKQRPDIA